MEIKDLIGKKIVDLISTVSEFEYQGGIPLEKSDSFMVLDDGHFIRFPQKNEKHIDLEK
ncbi:MAG: hypothetical protein J7604_24930 [Sporocytophaga sp.]|uniref:hypothetical protein n=1 Tax=Sporocytophaga sp. TaxID=2231183 RepID=UPI001AFEC6FE|nr:hypothetical protein [Sporocytophaga sp.]MBO9703476.1 hypothetical protein [Sporocytophaga sp.]